MPNVVMPSVVMPSVIMPSVIMPNVVMPSVVMPSVIMPSVVMPSVIMPSVVLPSVAASNHWKPLRLYLRFKLTSRSSLRKPEMKRKRSYSLANFIKLFTAVITSLSA
jgi:hypothetical protein